MRPTRQQETGMVVIVAVVILLLLWLTSCSTKKVVTEYVSVHDTLVVGHTDTLRIVSHTCKTDTIREVTYQTVTIRQDSTGVDTVRVETVHDNYHTFYVHDSVDTYKTVADSLRQVLDSQKEKNTVKIKARTPLWQYAVFFGIIVLVVWLVGKVK